ncbi:glycosyltransferase family 4 protein [Streptomyces sp. NPDC059785]|uniref:glycosyltransferase family 4 protein n=1 Tax=unclassified Streptomyces TaxID=2593676 RepID=UPI0036592FF1
MRICLVSPAYPPMVGGIGRNTWDLARGLVARGHEVVVLVACDRRPADAESGTVRKNLTVHWLEDGPRGAGPLGSLPGMSDLRRSVRVRRTLALLQARRPFDVVEFASWRALGAVHSLRKVAPQLLRATTGIAQVPKEEGHWRDRARDQLGRWVLGSAERICLVNSDVVVAPTTSHLEHLPERLRRSTAIMPFGVAVPTGRPRRSGGTVLFVGRLSGRKGFDLFAEAAGLLLAGTPAARIVLVGHDLADANGSAWERYGAALKRRYGDRVDWRPEVTEEQLDELYWTSDVCAMPSRYESFGLVFAEANLRGLPVVAWDTGFAREVGGESAVLVPCWDVQAYARALRDTLEATADGRMDGEAIRAVAEERYGVDRWVQRTEALYARTAAVSNEGPHHPTPAKGT